MKSTVSAIIVNYRTPDLTRAAADSCLAEPEVKEVIIVDNSAKEDSSGNDSLKEYSKKVKRVTLISVDNLGFGGGNNLGARQATGDYLFFLNSDATVHAGTLEKMMQVMHSNSSIGLVAPTVYLSDGTLQNDVCGPFPTPWALIARRLRQPCRSERPDWISGVAFMARREEFLDLGGFDENIFMYYEDVELCHRYARRAGLECRRVTEGTGVTHLGGASKLSTRRQKQEYFRSQDYFLKVAGYSRFSRWFVQLVRLPYYLVGMTVMWRKS